MLEFICSRCGEHIPGDDSFVGKHVVCPSCNATFTAAKSTTSPSPATAIATPEKAAHTKSKRPADSDDEAGHEGLPPLPLESLPSIRKEIPNIAMRWVPCIIVAGIALFVGLMLLPATRRVRVSSARTQSTNNLKNISLSFHGFHDANRRLPFNGTVAAVAGNNITGSWAFQILPYIDQNPVFTTHPLNTTASVWAYMCPGRGRPTVSTTGAWTDYFINTWINDIANGATNAPDIRRTLVGITDGTSNTIFVGHGSIDPNLYNQNAVIAQSTDLFKGGDPATARRSTTNQVDTANDQSLNWGGPFPQGALMAMGDATVRLFPYNTYSGGAITNGVSTIPGLGAFLTPTGGENISHPDA